MKWLVSVVSIVLAVEFLSPCGVIGNEAMKVVKAPFGKTSDGTLVDEYTMTSGNGLSVRVATYGAILTSVRTPDRDGKIAEVTLGFDTLDEYLAGHPYFGAFCGRVANRIAGGKFSLDGKDYELAVNNGPNHLHGGLKGFDKVVWNAEPISNKDRVGVRLSYTSPDGEEGYPGNLKVEVTYSVNAKNELRMEYRATTDKATPINLTNHTYWNLASGGAGDVLGHLLTIEADRFVPVDDVLIPTGELASVTETPMDFTHEVAIGKRIAEVGGDPKGYDHCYVLREHPADRLTPAARVVEPTSGRVMEVLTTQPGVQLYTGNFLDGSLSSRGAVFRQWHAFCLETQHFPDSIHQSNFPSTVLRPGETYKQVTVHRFSTL